MGNAWSKALSGEGLAGGTLPPSKKKSCSNSSFFEFPTNITPFTIDQGGGRGCFGARPCLGKGWLVAPCPPRKKKVAQIQVFLNFQQISHLLILTRGGGVRECLAARPRPGKGWLVSPCPPRKKKVAQIQVFLNFQQISHLLLLTRGGGGGNAWEQGPVRGKGWLVAPCPPRKKKVAQIQVFLNFQQISHLLILTRGGGAGMLGSKARPGKGLAGGTLPPSKKKSCSNSSFFEFPTNITPFNIDQGGGGGGNAWQQGPVRGKGWLVAPCPPRKKKVAQIQVFLNFQQISHLLLLTKGGGGDALEQGPVWERVGWWHPAPLEKKSCSNSSFFEFPTNITPFTIDQGGRRGCFGARPCLGKGWLVAPCPPRKKKLLKFKFF